MGVPDEIGATLVDHVLIIGLKWLKLVEGCNQMLGEQLCPQSFRLFIDRTGNLTIGTDSNTVILYTFCNASYNITVFHLHFTIYSKYTLNSDILSYSI